MNHTAVIAEDEPILRAQLKAKLARLWPELRIVAEVGDGDLAAWRRVIEVNYLGLLTGCHVMTPWLKSSALLAKKSSPSNSRLATRHSQLAPAVINIASVKNWPTSCPRNEPTDFRMPTSRARAEVRAVAKFIKLTQAISKMNSPMMPKSIKTCQRPPSCLPF